MRYFVIKYLFHYDLINYIVKKYINKLIRVNWSFYLYNTI